METLLRLIRLGFREDVSEKGFQDRHTAAYETGVDFDHTVGISVEVLGTNVGGGIR